MEFANPKTKEIFDFVAPDNPKIFVPEVAGVHGSFRGQLSNISPPVAESLEKQGCYHWLRRKQAGSTTSEPKQKQKPE